MDLDNFSTFQIRAENLTTQANELCDYLDGKPIEEIRAAVLREVMRQAQGDGVELSEAKVNPAEFKMNWVLPPEGFEALPSDVRIPMPTFVFKTRDQVIEIQMEFGNFGQSDLVVPVQASTLMDPQSEAVHTRPVKVLFIAAQDEKGFVHSESVHALDPNNEIHEIATNKDGLIYTWISTLALMEASYEENAIHMLNSKRGVLFELINGKPQEIELDPTVDILAQLNDSTESETREKNAAEFLETPFAKLLGFKRNGSLVSPYTILPPIFNFLKKLKETLGYGKTLSLLVESTSLDELLTKVSQLEPEIDFASTAYADFDTILKTLAEPRSSEYS